MMDTPMRWRFPGFFEVPGFGWLVKSLSVFSKVLVKIKIMDPPGFSESSPCDGPT